MPSEPRTRGSIFAVGGREARTGQLDVLEHFVSCCGASARIVVLTAASPDPEKRVREYGPAFRSLGVKKVSFFHQEFPEQASDIKLLRAVRKADGVFMTGGSQRKLVSTIGGTPLEAALRKGYATGLNLGGTSAGASAMSKVMIASGRARAAARQSSVRLSPGFGFVSQMIIDQHFRERDRYGRLFSAVVSNPSMLGLGLDEDTAFAFDADDKLAVRGSGTLTIVDGSQIEATNLNRVHEDSPVSFGGMRINVLSAGWSYDVAKRIVTAPDSIGSVSSGTG